MDLILLKVCANILVADQAIYVAGITSNVSMMTDDDTMDEQKVGKIVKPIITMIGEAATMHEANGPKLEKFIAANVLTMLCARDEAHPGIIVTNEEKSALLSILHKNGLDAIALDLMKDINEYYTKVGGEEEPDLPDNIKDFLDNMDFGKEA